MGTRPLFFLHLMKTGGSSLTFQFLRHYDMARTYPNVAIESPPVVEGRIAKEAKRAKSLVRYLRSCSRRTLSEVELFLPHMPACAIEETGFDGVTATIVRSPVERAVSHLAQITRDLSHDLGTEVDPRDVYAIEPIRARLLADHQVRAFSLDPQEAFDWDAGMEAQFDADVMLEEGLTHRRDLPATVPMDADRLDTAMQRVEELDVVGVTEEIPAFVDDLASEIGAPLDRGARINVGAPVEIDDELVNRIASDNRLDAELHEHARLLASTAA